MAFIRLVTLFILFISSLISESFAKTSIHQFIERPYIGAPDVKFFEKDKLKNTVRWQYYREKCKFMFEENSQVSVAIAEELITVMASYPKKYKCRLKAYKSHTKKYPYLQIIHKDLDGDSLENEFDPEPYTLGKYRFIFNDEDQDGIPNHLDWDKNNDGFSELKNIAESHKISELQLRIFQQFKILLIARDYYPSLYSLRSLYEVLDVVFRPYIEKRGRIKKLKKIIFVARKFNPSGYKTLAYYNSYFDTIYLSDSLLRMSLGEVAKKVVPLLFIMHLFMKLLIVFKHLKKGFLKEKCLKAIWQNFGMKQDSLCLKMKIKVQN